MKETDDLREISPSSVHKKWKAAHDASGDFAHDASSDGNDILEPSDDEAPASVDNIAKTPKTTVNATTNKAPEASSKAVTKTKEASTNEDAPIQKKKAEEETSEETTPAVTTTNIENAPNVMINDEDAAMHSNIPTISIHPALQPATLSPDATLHESILYKMQLEFEKFDSNKPES